jgi:hypothetical protein
MPNVISSGFFLQVIMMEGVMCLFEFEAYIIGHEVSGTRFTIKSQEIIYISLEMQQDLVLGQSASSKELATWRVWYSSMLHRLMFWSAMPLYKHCLANIFSPS